MDGIFVDNHPTGASYIEGVKVYGTQGAKNSIAGGATGATADSLIATFGNDFASDYAEVTNVVSSGSVTIAGIDFNVIDEGDTYRIEIPDINVIYTHMLGETSHSIMASTEHMDSMIVTLKGYQNKDYEYILSSHFMPETQSAVTAKIAYVEKAKELAGNATTADEFMTAMKETFPDYFGENYLEMTAGYLFAE